MSPTPDSAFADPQQVIAELRRELAEMQGRLGEALAERDEGEAQKVAMTEVLQVINSSPGDLAPLFDAMLERATRLCDAAFGHLSIYDGELIHAMAIHGASPEHAELLRSMPYRPEPGTALYDLVQGAPYLHEADIRQSETYRSGVGGRRILADLAGARTALWMSLRKEGTLLGVFTIYRQEVRPFSEKEIALLESFAAPAVIALENSRLLGELRERTRDLQESLDYQIATSDVLKVISRSTFDLQLVLDTLVEIAVRLCKADMGALSIRDGNLYRAAANYGFLPEYKAFAQIQPRSRGRGSVVTRALLGRRPVHVLDIASDPEHSAPELVTLGNMRTVLGVPLLREGEPIGVIGLSRSQVEAFTEQQIELVSTFADQVVIAIENARLLTETREALEQQTATAEVLQVINSSPGDLAPVFNAMLERAIWLCEAACGTLWTYDGESFRLAAQHDVPTEFDEFLRSVGTLRPTEGSNLRRLTDGEAYVHSEDASANPSPSSLGMRAALTRAGARSGLWVALRKDDALVGAIHIYRKAVRAFTDKQIALLQSFATQAVIAMENGRLITETREALEQQTATAEVLQVINSSPGDLAPVFDAMLDKAMQLCNAAFGLLLVPDGELQRTIAHRALPPALAEYFNRPVPGGVGLVGRLQAGEAAVQVADAADDEIYRVGAPARRALVDLGGARTAMAVALRRDGAYLGAFWLYRREVRPFTDKQIALLQNFAAQAVIAMENARLLTETREALEQQTATAEVLQVINSSPGDLAPVFDAILEKAHSLCGAAQGALGTYDSDYYFRSLAARGYPEPLAERFRQGFHGLTNPVTKPLIDGARFVHIPDLAAIDHPIPQAVVELGGFHAGLFVPLRKDGRLLGHISAARSEVRPFAEKEIALLENFAAQAVIAMENARLITETREALEQQTATAEVLGVINSSPGDLAPVFDAMLEKAMRLCGASFGNFLTYDGEFFHFVASRGHPRFGEWVRQLGPTRPVPGSMAEQFVNGAGMICAADIREEPAYRIPGAPARALVDIGGARSYVAIALRKDDALLGLFSIYRQEVRPFTEKQIALLQNFAAQAVIAMENARLLTETREALEQQTATAEVLQVINSSPGDLAPVFDAILDKAHSLCGADLGSLFTYDGERFWPVAAQRPPAQFSELMREGFRPGPGNPFGRVLEGEPLVHIADIRPLAAQHPDDAGLRVAVEVGLRTFMVVPLRKDNVLLGVITANRREVRPFTEKQIALLQNFAAQAVIAMENARLLTETREALEQQTATAEVLQVINSSPGDLAPVFDAMLDKAMRLCEAVYGELTTYDGERFHTAALRGVPVEYAEYKMHDPPNYGAGSAPLRILAGERVVHIIDLTDSDLYRRDDPNRRALVDLGGARSLLTVPLLKDGVVLGSIMIYRREVRPFTDKQIALLQNFAAQAVIAMENARLITETREALEQQTATAEVLQVINSSPGDLAPVFDAMLEKAHALCGAATGSLHLYDGEFVCAVATRGLPDEFVNIVRQPRRSGSPNAFLRGASFVQIIDLADPASTGGDKVLAAGHEIAGVRTYLRVPLRKDAALLGFIGAGRREVRPFTDKQITLLQNFAAQAVIAMENARLLGELRERTEEVAELNRGLEARVAEQVDELGRVGRLKRFLAPQLAELIVSHGDEKILESHRREIVVVFCDLRGYTAFTETAEPEEVLDFLRQYHGALGPLVSQFEGTLDQFSGDGIMVFFNDPVPCPDPAERAVKMAMAMREAAGTLIAHWRERGRDLGFGAGIAQGYATLGQIGFSERSGYTAIGTVCNVAARLCAEAKDGQILLGQLVNVALKGSVATELLGPLALKGLSQPVVAYNVPLGASQPALRVIEGGSPQTV